MVHTGSELIRSKLDPLDVVRVRTWNSLADAGVSAVLLIAGLRISALLQPPTGFIPEPVAIYSAIYSIYTTPTHPPRPSPLTTLCLRLPPPPFPPSSWPRPSGPFTYPEHSISPQPSYPAPHSWREYPLWPQWALSWPAACRLILFWPILVVETPFEQ